MDYKFLAIGSPASLLIPIETELQSLRRDYEKKDLEMGDMKAPRGLSVSLWSLFLPCALKAGNTFIGRKN